jgi:hypothetical protein
MQSSGLKKSITKFFSPKENPWLKKKLQCWLQQEVVEDHRSVEELELQLNWLEAL